MYSYEDLSTYSYSIGIKEQRCVSLSEFKDNFIINDEKNGISSQTIFDMGIERIDILTNIENVNEYISFCALNYDCKAAKNISEMNGIFLIECKKEFISDIKIDEIDFVFSSETIVVEVKTNITLKYNADYDFYPSINPSYIFKSDSWNMGMPLTYPWKSTNIASNYGFFYLEDVFDRNKDKVVLNSISFSENLNANLESIQYGTFTNNITWTALLNKLRAGKEIKLSSFDSSINIFNETTKENSVVFKYNFKKTAEGSIGGDIVYDVTINGINYKIKDMFFLF